MKNKIIEIKNEMEKRLAELKLKRKTIITRFKKRLEEEKMKEIKNSIVDK